MSKTIDDRVVEMRFDNSNFESNVKTSMSTLDRLKKALKFDGATSGLESIDASVKRMNFSPLGNAIETINAKFSAMQVIGMTALSNITTAAMNAGTRLASALTIDPITSGFQEYETQIGAIQTILANTQSKGSTLQDVNRALDELNKYADQTIYNFTEMTKNIGTFTAAGVDLDKAVTSIKGIANLAAVSGSTSVQASTAMYQLSQALAAGKVQLMDWNSVVNAGMGGELFQNALKRTATHMGKDVDGLIKKYGSFRESLTKGEWLTADVLTETLTQLSGAYTEADLIAQGYTQSQAQEITKLAETAVNAATKVKTFTQLFDTLGEALQSGWTTSWEIILGDFNEAQDMFTEISDALGSAISASADARNKVLGEGLSSGWKQLLNQGINDETGFIGSVKKVANEYGVNVDKMMEDGTTFETTLKSGWLTTDILTKSMDEYVTSLENMSGEQRIAAGYTGDQIVELRKFADQLKTNSSLAEEFANKLKMASGRENIIAGLWNVFTDLASVLTTVKNAFTDIFPPMTGDQLYDLTVKFREFTETLTPAPETLEKISRIATGVFSALDLIRKGVVTLLSPIGQLLGSDGMGSFADLLLDGALALADFFTALNKSADSDGFFNTISEFLGSGVKGLSNLISSATAGVRNFSDIFTFVGDTISNVASTIWNSLKDVFGWIQENVTLGDFFNGIMAGSSIIGVKQMADLLGQVKELFSGGILGWIFGIGGDDDSDTKSPLAEIGDQVTGILDKLHDSLQAFTTGIKATTLLEIAGALWLLGDSLEKISAIDTGAMVQGLVGMGTMFAMLNFSFRGIVKSLSKYDSKGIIKAGIALVAMALAMKSFADALSVMGQLDTDQLARGLVAMGIGLAELVGALKILNGSKISLRTSVSMIALAYAAGILADAMSKFSSLSWDEISRGLAAMGGALGELVASLSILSKVGGGGSLLGSVGILIAVQALGPLSDSLKKFGEMDWDSIGRGLAAMGGALGELTIALGALSAIGGFGAILGGTAILITVQSLDEISENLKKMGEMDWETIGRGLVAMGGALGELTIALGVLSAVGGFGAILGGTAILITVQSLEPIADTLERLGGMDWETIGRGLAAMGGALAELGLASWLTGLSGFSGLVGAGTITLVVQGLDQLANGLQKFGDMDWETIGRGLTAMGGALALVAGGSILAGITGIAGLVGAGTLLLAIQGLDDLANVLKKFGEMDWDSIGRGLAAMGGALGEVALGSLLNTFSGFGAGAIATVAEPLGQLADSVKKWADVTVPEGLGDQLGSLAGGISAFWNSGWGADAIATVAEPLGVMADSVKKWADVTVPEGLGDQIGSLANGIGAFWNSGWGADAIATVAEPLGVMADSVSKWTNVTVPENMQSDLEGLAAGISAFSFSALGGWSMGAVIDPLANLAASVQKWNGVTIPENMQSMLEGLAAGIEAFGLGTTTGGWSIGGLIDPLGQLADVLQKYSGLAVATDIGTSIKSLGEGVSSLSGKNPGDITGVVDAIKNLSDAVSAISGIDFAGATSKLTNFATAIDSINISGDKFANLGTNIVSSFVNAINAGVPQATSAATGLANAAITAFVVAASVGGLRSSSAGTAMIQGLSNGMRSGIGTLQTTTNTIITSVVTAITSKKALFLASGVNLIGETAKGILSGKGSVNAAITGALSSAVSIIRSNYGGFYSAGAYISQGLANGMNSKLSLIRSVASDMADEAAKATRAKALIMSPSRVFYKIGGYMGQGLANALHDYQEVSYKAGRDLGESTIDGLGKSITKMNDYLNADMNVNPTITPVLDLSDVKNGANELNDMLSGMTPTSTIGQINAIDKMMNSRVQNGSFDDVVKAVDRLRGALDNVGNTTYQIDGVTYDDGSNVANAVGALTRAIRLEGRV